MTIRNPFNASGSVSNLSDFRRAVNNGFRDLANALNRQQLVIKHGATLPGTPVQGQMFLLTATDGTNVAGVYCYNGTAWLRLDNA